MWTTIEKLNSIPKSESSQSDVYDSNIDSYIGHNCYNYNVISFDNHLKYLIDSLTKDLKENLKQSSIKIELYGVDTHYSEIAKNCLDLAWKTFCDGLTAKGYKYKIYDSNAKVNDPMEGTCHIKYRHLDIILK